MDPIATRRQTRWKTDRGWLTPSAYYRFYGGDRPERAQFMSEDELMMRKMVQVRQGIYLTPSQTFFRTGRMHITNQARQKCTCLDNLLKKVKCKHLILADMIEADPELKRQYPIRTSGSRFLATTSQ